MKVSCFFNWKIFVSWVCIIVQVMSKTHHDFEEVLSETAQAEIQYGI